LLFSIRQFYIKIERVIGGIAGDKFAERSRMRGGGALVSRDMIVFREGLLLQRVMPRNFKESTKWCGGSVKPWRRKLNTVKSAYLLAGSEFQRI
jgi:hypothetical protein